MKPKTRLSYVHDVLFALALSHARPRRRRPGHQIIQRSRSKSTLECAAEVLPLFTLDIHIAYI